MENYGNQGKEKNSPVKSEQTPWLSRWEKVVVALAFAALLGVRLSHLSGPLDEPSWRQAWCAVHAREVGRAWPTNWLANQINFRGNQNISYWTLPLYETVVGLAYRVAGGEHLAMARTITMLSFVWATGMFFKVVREGFGGRVAWLAALAFWMQPLNIFYSRAVHYESLLMALWLAFFWCSIRFAKRYRAADWFCAAACSALAAWIKPTFLIWITLPVLSYAWWVTPPVRKWRRLAFVMLLCAIPAAVAVSCHAYRLHFEGGILNTPLYADPYNAVYAKSWFVGQWAERWSAEFWRKIVYSVMWTVVTPHGAMLALAAPLSSRFKDRGLGWILLATWTLGLVAFTFSFTRLIAGHDYWRLPYGPVCAVWLGISLDGLTGLAKHRGLRVALLVTAIAVLASGIAPGLGRGPYFQHDIQRIKVGEAIRDETPFDALVLSTTIGRSTGPTDPRILYFADRRGWANRIDDLSPDLLRQYRDAGAAYVAVLVTPEHLPLSPRWSWMIECPVQERPLTDDKERSIGSLFLYSLKECPL